MYVYHIYAYIYANVHTYAYTDRYAWMTGFFHAIICPLSMILALKLKD